MGADIHMYAERQLSNGDWAMCEDFKSKDYAVYNHKGVLGDYTRLFPRVNDRDYRFFAALAGVRGVGPDPKGLPDDVSPYVKEASDGWDGDGHSHSWYLASEFVPIFMEHRLNEAEIVETMEKRMNASSPEAVAHILEKYLGLEVPEMYGEDGPQIDKLRFVFWFDN